MKSRISIVFLIDYFHRTGGAERHLCQLVRSLPPERFDCRVVIFDMGPNALLDEVRACGISVIHVPVAREYAPAALPRAIELSRIMRSCNADIVQAFHQKSDTFGALVAWLSGVRHIVSSKRDIAGMKKPRHFFLNRRLRFLFERVIVVANAVGDVVAAHERVDRSRIVTIYNGVDETAFRPPTAVERDNERKRLGFGGDDFVTGMVAGLRPEKDHETFFKGATAALQHIPTLKLLVVGAGPLLEHYRAMCRTNGLDGRAVFAGDVTDVARYLKAMDVGCLLPSGNEGFSNAVLEKMATGLPVIVSDVGGNAEAVRDGINGYVIGARDDAAFVAALIDMHADPRRRAAMGTASRRIVEERFTLESMCARHRALYESLVA